MKLKTCKVCKTKFPPERPLQSVCSFECSLEIAKKKAIKSDKIALQAKNRELRAAKEAIKTRKDHIKELQKIFNRWIRRRDFGKPCVSCGRVNMQKVNAGHFMPTSTRPMLRFEPDNVHLQDEYCNTHLHGNLVNYRIELIKRIGLERVEWLEGNHPPAKWTIPELIEMKAKYSKLARELKNT